MENVRRYQVELVHSLSHDSAQWGKFERGKTQVITNKAQVAYYKAQPEFIVTRLRDPKEVTPKAVSRTPVKTTSKAPPPPVSDDEDEDEDDEEEEEEDEEDEEESEEEDDSDEESEDEEEEEEVSGHYTKSQLASLTKQALLELGKTEFKLKVDDSLSKPQLVGEILKAQLAAAKATK